MNIKHKILIILFTVFVVNFQRVHSQDKKLLANDSQKAINYNDKRENLIKSVELLNDALLTKKYEELIKLIFIPKIFENDITDSDKNEKSLFIVKQMIEESEIAGMNFVIHIKSPQTIIEVDNNLFSIVPQTTNIVVENSNRVRDKNGKTIVGGKYKSTGYLLAISRNDGKTWKFWNEVSNVNLKNEFPEAAKKIKLPRTTKPYFLKD